ncbi:MAG: hypothetical protein ACE5FO_12840 [Parvularculaceae bacterium]
MGKLRALSDTATEATDGRLYISGYINAHYMDHDGVARTVGKNLNRPLWQIREASLFFDVTATEFFTLSGELELSYDFSDRAASGREDRFAGHLNYLYADLSVTDLLDADTETYGSLRFRGGRFLVPFLSYNENKPSFRQTLMSQPFTAWQLSPVNNIAIDFERFGWSDFGVMVDWERAFGSIGAFDLKIAVINGLESDGPGLDANTVRLDPPGMMKPTMTPRDGLFANRRHGWGFDGENDNLATVFKASYSLAALPVDFGVSWYRGKWDAAGEHDLNMYGAHFNLLQRNWSLKGEYVKADVEETPGLLITTAPGPAALNTTTGDFNMRAWYVEASGAVLRYGVNDQRYVRLVTRLDDVDTNDKIAFTPFDRFRVTSGMEWEFLPQIRMRYEWQRSFLDDFGKAPGPFVAAGGEREIDMHMFSIIAYF